MSYLLRNPKDRAMVNDRFKRYFSIPFSDFYDSSLVAYTGKISIEIVKFNDYLFKIHGESENEISLEELIVKHYSEEAMKFISDLL